MQEYALKRAKRPTKGQKAREEDGANAKRREIDRGALSPGKIPVDIAPSACPRGPPTAPKLVEVDRAFQSLSGAVSSGKPAPTPPPLLYSRGPQQTRRRGRETALSRPGCASVGSTRRARPSRPFEQGRGEVNLLFFFNGVPEVVPGVRCGFWRDECIGVSGVQFFSGVVGV